MNFIICPSYRCSQIGSHTKKIGISSPPCGKGRGGYKLLPEEIDENVINLVKEMQLSGAAMSYNILIGIAKGIVCANDRNLLK